MGQRLFKAMKKSRTRVKAKTYCLTIPFLWSPSFPYEGQTKWFEDALITFSLARCSPQGAHLQSIDNDGVFRKGSCLRLEFSPSRISFFLAGTDTLILSILKLYKGFVFETFTNQPFSSDNLYKICPSFLCSTKHTWTKPVLGNFEIYSG